jgi:hypothetical protein
MTFRVSWEVFGWVFFLGGIFNVLVAHFKWYETGMISRLNWSSHRTLAALFSKDFRRGLYILGCGCMLFGVGVLLLVYRRTP